MNTGNLLAKLNIKKVSKTAWVLLAITLVGLAFRLYHIEFGLPHSFNADEPEFSELAILYTYEFKDIVQNNNYFRLIPISYVYGTFPVYFLTISLMGFSKAMNLMSIPFDKTTLFIFLRVVIAFASLALIPVTVTLFKRVFSNRVISSALVICTVLAALNWKFIVHAHYVNADIVLVLLNTITLIFLVAYYKAESTKSSSHYLLLAGMFFGLCMGTKITALLIVPAILFLILKRKDYLGLFGFGLATLAWFMFTNPFSVIFYDDFISRVLALGTKEAGVVFDSVDYSPFKYIDALSEILTIPILLTAVFGMIAAFKSKGERTVHIFLIFIVAIYVVFFSLQSRRVDRWMLPVLPILIIYATYGFTLLRQLVSKPIAILLGVVVLGYYLYYPALLLTQFQRYTPKAEAYLWMKENTSELSTKLAYTEEGLDPLNKLPLAKVRQYEVYSSDNAQLFFPDNPELYDYVILSSRPMENFKKEAVKQLYPEYSGWWQAFENTVQDKTKFELVKEFTLPKPNLIPLSDVMIYKKL